MSGQGSDLAIVMTLFVVATVFTPVKNTLQEHVDRRIKPAGQVLPAPGHHAGVDDLLLLAALHRRGVLTDEEFPAEKKEILGIWRGGAGAWGVFRIPFPSYVRSA